MMIITLRRILYNSNQCNVLEYVIYACCRYAVQNKSFLWYTYRTTLYFFEMSLFKLFNVLSKNLFEITKNTS